MSEEKTEVVPSQRSKILKKLETPEEVQKDIQRIYSDAKKFLASADKHPLKSLIERQVNSIKLDVDNTTKINKMNIHQVTGFWHNAYTLLDAVKETVSKK